MELTDSGSLLDRFARMAGRGVVESEQELIEMREVRNEIAHEYLLGDVADFFNSVFVLSSLKLQVVENLFVLSAKIH
jgi:hypothetical protein